MTYVSCCIDDDYEILNEYPYTIRRKDNEKEIKETIEKSDDYVYYYYY